MPPWKKPCASFPLSAATIRAISRSSVTEARADCTPPIWRARSACRRSSFRRIPEPSRRWESCSPMWSGTCRSLFCLPVPAGGQSQMRALLRQIDRRFARLHRRALSELRREGFDADRARASHRLDLRYQGQSYELSVPFTPAFARIFTASTRRLTAMLIPSGLWKSSTCAFAW